MLSARFDGPEEDFNPVNTTNEYYVDLINSEMLLTCAHLFNFSFCFILDIASGPHYIFKCFYFWCINMYYMKLKLIYSLFVAKLYLLGQENSN